MHAVAYSEPTRRSAVAALCRSHHADLVALATRFMPLHGAKDVVGEVYQDLLGLDIHTFQNIQDLPRYAKTMTRHKAYRTLNRERMRRTVPIIADLDGIPGDQVLHKVRNWDLNMDIETFLQHLQPAEYAKIIRLYYLLGYPHRDIVIEMDLPSVGASKTKLSRACKKFLELYLRFNPDDDPDGFGKRYTSDSVDPAVKDRRPADGNGYDVGFCCNGHTPVKADPAFHVYLNQLFMDHLAMNQSAFPVRYDGGANTGAGKTSLDLADVLRLLIGETHQETVLQLRRAMQEDPEQTDIIDGYAQMLTTLGAAEKVIGFLQADMHEHLDRIESFAAPAVLQPANDREKDARRVLFIRLATPADHAGLSPDPDQDWIVYPPAEKAPSDPPASQQFFSTLLHNSALTGVYPWKFEVNIYRKNNSATVPPFAAFLTPEQRSKLPVPMLPAFDADAGLYDGVRLALAREILQGELELLNADGDPVSPDNIREDLFIPPPTCLRKYLSQRFIPDDGTMGERVFEIKLDPDHPQSLGDLERIVLRIQWRRLQQATAEAVLGSLYEKWRAEGDDDHEPAYIRWEAAGVFALCHRRDASPFAMSPDDSPHQRKINAVADIPILRLKLDDRIFQRNMIRVGAQLVSRMEVSDLESPGTPPQTFLLLRPTSAEEEREYPYFRLEFLSDRTPC